MAAELVCPSCNAKLRLQAPSPNRRVQCPKCGHSITVPKNPADEQQLDEPTEPGCDQASGTQKKPKKNRKPRPFKLKEAERSRGRSLRILALILGPLVLIGGLVALLLMILPGGDSSLKVQSCSIKQDKGEVFVSLRMSGKLLFPTLGQTITLQNGGGNPDFKLLFPDGTTRPADGTFFDLKKVLQDAGFDPPRPDPHAGRPISQEIQKGVLGQRVKIQFNDVGSIEGLELNDRPTSLELGVLFKVSAKDLERHLKAGPLQLQFRERPPTALKPD